MKRFRRSYLTSMVPALALLGSMLFGNQPANALVADHVGAGAAIKAPQAPPVQPGNPLIHPTTHGATGGSGANTPAGPAQTSNVLIVGSGAGCPGAGYTTIQSAMDAANPGDTIQICAGTYTENLTVTKSLTLAGAGANTIVVPAVSNPNCGGAGGGSLCPGGSNIMLVQANNVTIHDLTLNGDNPALTSGIVVNGADLDARNGIITNHLLGVYHNLVVYNTTVRNIYLRGMYASTSGGTFNFHNNTVDNVMADPSSIAMFSYTSSGIMANNTVSRANDAISANWSMGTQFLNNTVTDSGSGVHTDNAGGAGGVTDLIQNNSVSACMTDGYGVWVFAPYNSPTFQDNVVTGCAVGLAVFGQNAPATPVFNHNIVNGQGALVSSGGSVGAYVSTSLLGYGFSPVSATFTRNTLTNNDYGFYVDNASTNPVNVAIHNSDIYGNTIYGLENDSASTIDAINNWWGAATGPVVGQQRTTGADHITGNATYSPFIAGQDYAHFTPSTPITVSLNTTITLDLLVNATTQPAIGQQSYLTFTTSLLQNVNPNTGVNTNAVTPDLTTFNQDIQNQVCNGPGACTFGNLTADPGTIAYASGVAPTGPSATGDFRVAQVTFSANALGDALIHWQFSPPDAANRNSKIVDASSNTVSDPTLYQDYTIHIVHPTFTGHVTWEGRPAQPNALQALPITLTLTQGSNAYNFTGLTTDANGNFSVDVNGLPNGTYTWRVKGPQYLSTSGTVALNRAVNTFVEMGLQPVGDANNDNLVDITDYSILYATFGHTSGDLRADFNGDGTVDVTDFALMRGNFGRLGNLPGKAAPKPTNGSATLELRPQGNAPANGGTVHVGDHFTLELWVNAQQGTNVVGQQSYIAFPANQLQLRSTTVGSSGAAGTSLVTPDRNVLDLTLQNAICNGPGACAFSGQKVPAGSLAFASSTLNGTAGSGAFRVGQVTVQATAAGTARLHWQFSPQDPTTRNTKIVTDDGTTVSRPGQFVDYVLNILSTGK